MKIMKKIIAVILFLSFLVGCFCISTAVSRVQSNDASAKVKITFEQFYKQENNSVDVVLMGSSALYREYISIENWGKYGFTSYPLATMSQPFNSVKYLIEETLKTQNPSLFVIEIRQLVNDVIYERNNNGASEQYSDEMKRFLANCMPFSYNRYEMIKELLPDDVLCSYFDFIRNHRNWDSMKLSSFFKNLFYEITYDDFINMKCPDVISEYQPIESKEICTEESYTLPTESRSELDSLLSFIEEKGVAVLFVSTPYQESEESEAAENSIAEYLSEKGYHYLNCNDYYEKIGIDFSSDFYDDKHTNILGALKVTDFIGAYLEENYSFSKKYTSKTKDEWNEAYSLWNGEREKSCETTQENEREVDS